MPVISEVVLQELRNGSPSGELEFIQNHGFMFASAHEALFLDGRTTFYTEPVEADVDADPDLIEEFLHQFSRSVSGSASVPDLASLLLDSAEAIFGELATELDFDTDARILSAWQASNDKFTAGMKELRGLPNPTSLNAELNLVKNLSTLIGNLKPPGIIKQIVLLTEVGDFRFLTDLTKPFTENENMKERIQTLCLILALMGFARDKRLAKDDENKSVAGAKSQFSDVYHIAAAATCTFFLTADKRCSKLAYAVYEALGLKTQVCLVDTSEVGNALSILGHDFWP